MANYVVMFFNNKYMKDTVFNTYKSYYYKYKWDPTTGKSIPLSDEEAVAARKKAMEDQLERGTTTDINEARLFSTKNAASVAAGRSGYKKKDGAFSLVPVEIIPQRIVPATDSD